VFAADVLNNSLVDYSTFLITFRGQPTISVADSYAKILRRISLVPGLQDRVRVFLLPEPVFPPDIKPGPFTPPPSLEQLKDPSAAKKAQQDRTMVEKYSGNSFEPVFAILSKEATVKKQGALEYGFVLANALAALAATFVYTVDMYSLNGNFAERALAGDPNSSGVYICKSIVNDLRHGNYTGR
jgi:hypothetical protein